jgi:hypothetical protein
MLVSFFMTARHAANDLSQSRATVAYSAHMAQRRVRRCKAGIAVVSVLVGMSAIGPKQTCTYAPQMSAFGGKADMTFALRNVRL